MELDDVIKEFLVESYENLDELDRSLIQLESNPNDRGKLAAIFRTVHTIKGTCGFLGLSKLEKVTHVGENLLSKLRDGEICLQPDITTGLLSLVDAIRQMLSNVESSGCEGDNDYADLQATLIELQSLNREMQAVAGATSPTIENESTESSPTIFDSGKETADHSQAEGKAKKQRSKPQSTVTSAAVEDLSAATPNMTEASAVQPVPTPAAATAKAENTSTANPVPATQTSKRSGDESTGNSSTISESSIRVDVALLEKLMTRVGELVLARNQLMQLNSGLADSSLQNAMQRLNLITSELQEGVMKTRMQPIGNVWSKFPRVVRDLASMCGKEVRIEMEGKETELDKTIIEAIKDPLTHLIRNTVDHGIERPDVRRQANKPAEGLLKLRAFHESGQVIIEIADDGAGLNLEKIRNKAVEKGLITADQVAKLHDRDVANLIFLPGFSTAEKVSNVSGRGVGMDVVKTNIEKIGGSVDLQTQPGSGTTIRIRIPLTLAIIPALVVGCDGDRYAIPQVNLLELVRVDQGDMNSRIEWIQGAPVYRLRGRLLPLVYLRNVLGLQSREAQSQDSSVNIVVLRADDQQFGLVVDGVRDTEEIVVKPLSKQLKGITAYAGMTIMGDGTVALILDVVGLAQSAHVITTTKSRSISEIEEDDLARRGKMQTLLVLGVGNEHRYALPTSQVTRLEKIQASKVEKADHREVVQYRSEILPLARLSDIMGVGSYEHAKEILDVVVFSENGNSFGLVVDQILDIVQSEVSIKELNQNARVIGTTVISNRVTDLLNVREVVCAADPHFYQPSTVGLAHE
ncbi:MAG TPA: chemotaxis protein CheA [Pirellulaceae bacterium]|nr:chemotaxis protein CheA [Pirellulaceae bacterium]HMO94430.1 chemotaxis protein CheA [Pirellulaceae bacterium]HMP71573.1 chemotaxis protein CheA [Pirellulaceae bacterium]